MYNGKKVLLIAGGGTLGTYTAKELLRLGCEVEVICPEEKVSDHERLTFHRSLATDELLQDLFSKTHYHGIVNFIHYKKAEDYMKIYPMLIANTDHLIFLSSYRVYANEQHPITEEAPRLYDVIKDPEFLETEDYSVPKCKVEDFLSTEHPNDAWTVVRPVISFSQRRMDLLLYSGHTLMAYAAEGKELLMPELVRNFGAGLDWAGNSGKLIANLLFKQEAMGERFSVYSGHGMTWGDVADLYTELIGLKVRWCSEEEFVANTPSIQAGHKWAWPYDRRYDRSMDASKVLRVTGLKKEDFGTIREGILTELALIQAEENAK